jgi:hypothetical protein
MMSKQKRTDVGRGIGDRVRVVRGNRTDCGMVVESSLRVSTDGTWHEMYRCKIELDGVGVRDYRLEAGSYWTENPGMPVSIEAENVE